MHISADGIDFIRNEEGCRLTAYQDSGGVWTIGVGHVGPEATAGAVITQARADELLRSDLARFEAAVDKAVAYPQLTQGQFDALVSLCFNIGAGNFASSTLVKKLNAGNAAACAGEFPRWCKVAGQYNEVLAKRRGRELWVFARASR